MVVSALLPGMKQDASVCVCVIFHLHHILRGQVSRQGHVFKAGMAFIIIGPVLHLTGRWESKQKKLMLDKSDDYNNTHTPGMCVNVQEFNQTW